MSTEIKVPALPESVSDATIATWHKKAGDSIRRDENLVDLETDKVVLEVPAPVTGILKSIERQQGETVVADDLLGIVEEQDIEDDSNAGSEAVKDTDSDADKNSDDSASGAADSEASKEPEKSASDQAGKDQQSAPKDAAPSPSARKLAADNDVDTSAVDGTGRGGRITKPDVQNFLQSAGSRPEQRVKMSRLRSRIAERMKEAQNTAAILTSFNEVDLKAVSAMRKQYKDLFVETHDVRLGFMSFFVRACCVALQRHPVVNASVEDNEIVYHGYQDIGVAVSIDRGLVVPVLRNAHLLSLADIEKQIRDLAGKAHDGSLAMEDLQGGTFTVTNGGVFGSLLSTPLLNPPQSAILGMHTIKDRPVVINGEITVRPMMYIALSYDHRIVDGKDAVQFLVTVKELLEDPARLLLDI
ncbi:MAG: 2-oxoglutarate dehydrogenase complex dihydrolipoyllysine-residue succinyltransferase [Gammaproteobacteria bacterium]|jgi:2-oxoglutarate dehydrogenase E2 component (dihydrolipoamide succinyltransferase)|nr:2-oxoglutarate dehydrogenase complex dihydrolipoyllysine-residue succinyltransferase [Gammaproteobacteria bacterium]